MSKEELEKEAREYLAEHSEYSEVFGQTFVAVDTLTAMVDFAEPREKHISELEAQIEKMRCCINDLVHLGEFNEHTDEEYLNYQVHEALNNAEQFIKEIKEK